MIRHGGWEIHGAYDADTVLDDGFSSLSHFDVAATFRREIDDHGAAAHDVYHIACNQNGSFSTRDCGGGNHHVLFFEDRGHLLALAANLFISECARISALPFSAGSDCDVDELGTQAFDLLFYGRADV